MDLTNQIIIVIDKLFDYIRVQHCMLKKLLLCAIFLLLLSAVGCGQKQIMLMNAPLDKGDKVPYPPSEEELLQLQSDIKKVISMLIEQGLDMQLPDFEIDTESRIISLWNLCTKVPMSIEMRNKLLSHNSIDDRFEELNNYVQLILKKSFN